MADVAVDDELLTIDELAARTGLTVRTVRFYAAQGLLPPPLRRGRVGYYGPGHRRRLDFVRELQEYGYGLSVIERCLARIPVDATAGELAVHRALLAPWQPEECERLDEAELDRRAGRALTDADREFLTGIGVLVPASGGTFVARPSILAVGVELLSMPIPRETLRQAAAVIDQHAAAVAAGLTEVFRAGIWEPYRAGELPAEDAGQLAAVVARLRPIAVQGLVAAFEKAADQALRKPSDL